LRHHQLFCLQDTATHSRDGNTTATHSDAKQQTASNCNTLQHAATRRALTRSTGLRHHPRPTRDGPRA